MLLKSFGKGRVICLFGVLSRCDFCPEQPVLFFCRRFVYRPVSLDVAFTLVPEIAVPSSLSQIHDLPPFCDGDYCFKINNSGSDSYVGCFAKDLIPPVINITLPKRHVNNLTAFNITATDSSNVSMNVSINGVQTFSVGKNSTSQLYQDIISLPIGLHNISVDSQDSANRNTTAFIEFYLTTDGVKLEIEGSSSSVVLWFRGLLSKLNWRILR